MSRKAETRYESSAYALTRFPRSTAVRVSDGVPPLHLTLPGVPLFDGFHSHSRASVAWRTSVRSSYCDQRKRAGPWPPRARQLALQSGGVIGGAGESGGVAREIFERPPFYVDCQSRFGG